jgi:YbbR domain-containing protein
MKKWIFVIVGVFLAIVVFVKIANTSVLEITVSGVPANHVSNYRPLKWQKYYF